MDTHISDPTVATKLTRTLAAQASAVTYEALSEPVRELARQCVLDYFGVALAGADDPLAHILLDELEEAGGAAQSSVIGHKARLPALSAALVNGAIGQALGIAGTQASGLKSQFGTMCKPFHAGKASHNGLLAARLAARGFSSRPDLVECEQGFALTHGPDFRPEAALTAPPNGFYIFANLFKYHAACYLTHGPIECARALRERHGIEANHVARMTLSLDR